MKRALKRHSLTCIILFSIGVSLCYLLLVKFTCGMWFETNDDVFLTELFSGEFTGKPEFRCTFVSAAISYPVTLLYRLFPAVPWWGLTLFVFLWGSLAVIMASLWYKAENEKQFLLGGILLCIALLLGIHIFGQVQFTSVAVLLAVAGFVAAFSLGPCRAGYAAFLLLEALACFLRMDSMMIVQPLGLAFLVGRCFLEERADWSSLKKYCKQVLLWILIPIALVVATVGIKQLTFRGQEWEEFLAMDTTRVYLGDYQETIPYSAVEDILSKYGVDETEYEQFLNYRYVYTKETFSPQCIRELLPRVKEIRDYGKSTNSFWTAVRELFFTSTEFWHLHQITALFCIAVGLFLVAVRLWNYVFTWFLGSLGYAVSIFILAYRNRFVLRVMMPFYVGAILLLSVLLFWTLRELCHGEKSLSEECQGERASVSLCHRERNTLWLRLASGTLILTLLGSALYTGRAQFAYIRLQNHLVNHIAYMNMRDIKAYCEAHPEMNFLLDISYAKIISTEVFETAYYAPSNYCYTGSWFSLYPSLIAEEREYLKNGDFYFCVYEGQEFKGLDALEFYASVYRTEPILVDSFKISTGATIWVYHIKW